VKDGFTVKFTACEAKLLKWRWHY